MNDEVDSDKCMAVRCWDTVLLTFCFSDIHVYICSPPENDQYRIVLNVLYITATS